MQQSYKPYKISHNNTAPPPPRPKYHHHLFPFRTMILRPEVNLLGWRDVKVQELRNLHWLAMSMSYAPLPPPPHQRHSLIITAFVFCHSIWSDPSPSPHYGEGYHLPSPLLSTGPHQRVSCCNWPRSWWSPHLYASPPHSEAHSQTVVEAPRDLSVLALCPCLETDTAIVEPICFALKSFRGSRPTIRSRWQSLSSARTARVVFVKREFYRNYFSFYVILDTPIPPRWEYPVSYSTF